MVPGVRSCHHSPKIAIWHISIWFDRAELRACAWGRTQSLSLAWPCLFVSSSLLCLDNTQISTKIGRLTRTAPSLRDMIFNLMPRMMEKPHSLRKATSQNVSTFGSRRPRSLLVSLSCCLVDEGNQMIYHPTPALSTASLFLLAPCPHDHHQWGVQRSILFSFFFF